MRRNSRSITTNFGKNQGRFSQHKIIELNQSFLKIRGRFAPTPSGPLHFGSLIAALGSYLHAKSRGGKWLIRIDDLDRQRNVSNADTTILKTLENLGLHWDEDVLYQSSRISTYQEAINQLLDIDLVYPCSCSRKEIGNKPYQGICRNGIKQDKNNFALRIRTNHKKIEFDDLKQGPCSQDIETEVGDFILKRADGFIAYHLATVIDDQWQQISEVVRGADLLDSTPRQIYLQRLFGFAQAEYLHLPVATDQHGQKLGKSNGAISIDQKIDISVGTASQLLYEALSFLGQNPPDQLLTEAVEDCIRWGLDNWNLELVPSQKNKNPHIFNA